MTKSSPAWRAFRIPASFEGCSFLNASTNSSSFFHPSTDFIPVVMIVGKGRVNIRQRDALVVYKDFFRREPVGFMP